MKNRTGLKILFAFVLLAFIATAAFMGWYLMNHGISKEESRTVVSTWYSNKPYNNTLTFYDNGTYTSESFGAPEGTYEVKSDTEWVLTDDTGSVRNVEINGSSLTFRVDNILHEYYNSKDLLPQKEENEEDVDYGVVSLRLTMAQKLIDQGSWNGEGHTLEGTLTTIVIDGTEYGYTVDDVSVENEETLRYTLTIDGKKKALLMSVDQETLVYTIDLDGMVFTAPGENLKLDS